MYRELDSFRQALRKELEGTLPPLAGVDPDKLLETYLDQLTLYVGADVADATLTVLALNANDEVLGYLPDQPNTPIGFEKIVAWLESLRELYHLRIIAVACETTGVFYWAWWDALGQHPNIARVLFNPRTTEHMAEVLSKRVRDELVDALLLAEQLRLGSTPEVVLPTDPQLLTARLCSRTARDLARQVNRLKNQLRALLRGLNPALSQTFPGTQLHHPAVYALLRHYLFPDDLVAAGVDAIETLLTQHSRSAFGRDHAQRLIDTCRTCLIRPMERPVVHLRVKQLLDEIALTTTHKKTLLKTGYALIQDRPETQLLLTASGAGISNTLALVSELGGSERFVDGDHMACFLGLTTSKHTSGTSVSHFKHITKQGSPNGRYAAVNLAGHLKRRVPKYQTMYKRIKGRKPPRKGHFVALVAIARDFVANVLYDMWANQRPFFLTVEDYRQYRQDHPAIAHP